MLRVLGSALRDGVKKVAAAANLPLVSSNEAGFISRQVRCFGALAPKQPQLLLGYKEKCQSPTLLSESVNKLLVTHVRHGAGVKKQKLYIPPKDKVVYFSLKNGKRITNKEVVKRFYRLNWGIWIRTIAGRHKHLWKKTPQRRRRARTHVFTNATQSYMLDKMVTKFWKRPKYYVDDFYEPYHTREEYFRTQMKPKPLPD